MSEKIKVEIFRDVSASSALDIDIAHEGLAKIVAQINSNPFEVLRDTRKLRVTNDASSPINFEAINWPSFEADYSIILTDKKIISKDSHRETFGTAIRYADRNYINGIAVVRTDTIQPELTAAHEVGHLMGVKYPERDALYLHCQSPLCVMHEQAKHMETTERIAKKGLSGILERYGYRPAEYATVEKSIAQKFCTSCQEQLARKAFFALKYLNGESMSPSWL